MATAQYERSGTRLSAHPDPDPDPELRIKSPNSVPDPSVPDHRMQYLKSHVELGVRSIPVPCLFHTHSRPDKVFSTYSPCIIAGTSKRQSSFQTLRIKYAIQTFRIRQHRNVHSGHVVLISSHIYIYIIYIYTYTSSLHAWGYGVSALLGSSVVYPAALGFRAGLGIANKTLIGSLKLRVYVRVQALGVAVGLHRRISVELEPRERGRLKQPAQSNLKKLVPRCKMPLCSAITRHLSSGPILNSIHTCYLQA